MAGRLLHSEAYRPFFLIFPVAIVGALALWSTVLLVGPLADGAAVRPIDHATLMIWGVLGSAVLGFLLTAYPRQNEARPPGPRALGLALGAQLALMGALVGSWVGLPTASAATALGVLVWGGALAWAARIAAVSLGRRWDGTTAAVPLTLLVGLGGWWMVRAGPDPGVGVALGLHGFLVGLALSLLDRLLPFFASKAVPGYSGSRERAFPLLMVSALTLRASGLGPAGLWDLAVITLLARQALGWRVDQVVRTPMIAVLLLGVGWLGVGYAVDLALGPGPLATHLWTLGGMTTLVLGIATRVTRGHGGLPVALDGWTTLALALLQVAVLLRAVIPALYPVSSTLQLHGSAALVALAFSVWGLRHLPLLVGAPAR